MTDPKPRRFTANEIQQMADGWSAIPPTAVAMLRQAASDLSERERIMAIVGEKCQRLRDPFTGEISHHKAFGKFQVLIKNCPACAIRRAAALETDHA